ncbi:Compactin diketide synthase mokB [Penicillium rolfsii]|nr:Compactin diketide synthase mokB [Penicillium rolfsii]
MPLRLLCLHGWGTSEKVSMPMFKNSLIGELQRDNTATFHFLEGELDSDPGPGIAGFYDPPYYSYYRFPRTFSPTDDDETDILTAYEQIDEAVALYGPFDGILGFSHGGTLAAGYLIHHAKMWPGQALPFQCAIFVNSLPPFRMHPGQRPVIDQGLEGWIRIPVVNIAGAMDELFEYSLALHRICDQRCSNFVVHGKGHDVPTDAKNVAIMAGAIRKLSVNMLCEIMKEFPIVLETTGSELFEESIPRSEIGDGGTSEGPQDELSILMEDASMPIAVIGMGFRGPGDVTDTNRLWQMMHDKREAWSSIPKERWNHKAFFHPDHARHGTINVEGGHFIAEDLSLFDAPFFNMTSDEAAAMDPQQRLLLEVTYEGLENAGIPLSRVMGTKTSCYVGSFGADYTDLLLRDPECVPMYQCTNAGQSRAMMSNRVSYFFDLKGPSVTVDTACSGSLVALHLACQSLRTQDASMAIAAGVNLILSHDFMSTMSMMRFLSPDGRCHTFDEKANGYSRGEAIACLILKPLVSALRDGDTIRAIIRGTGSNQDGRTPGITLPNGTAQEALIRDVYARAGLCPHETEVIEAHGTGTQAGDPVEIGAIARCFELGHDPDRVLRIGSIKTNVGHLEGASGVAGVIKAIMMLEKRIILPSRNFETPNPRISFEEWNLKVPQAPESWDTPGPHRVSVNSFGYGGSNAHVILEDAFGYLTERGLQRRFRSPSHAAQKRQIVVGPSEYAEPPRQRIFMISAFDEWSCRSQIENLRVYLESKKDFVEDDFVDDLAFTLNEHRSSFVWKAAVIGSSIPDLCDIISGESIIRCSAQRPNLSFVFTGQGAQWAGMGKELLHTFPVFWESISRIDRYLSELGSPFYVSEELSRSSEDSQLSHPLLSQTLCSALQIALVDLLSSWSIYPSSVMGHSSGEIAAAYACGALSMEDAMAVAYFRGIAASQILIAPDMKGAMIAVGMSNESAQGYLERLTSGKAVVACINSPSSVTVSGDLIAIDELSDILKDKSVFFRRLAVDVAYHSHHMEIFANEYLASIEHISPQHTHDLVSNFNQIRMFSSVTGTEIQTFEMDAQYWVSNLLGQVKFSKAFRNLCFETDFQQAMPGLTSRKLKRHGTARKPGVDCLLEIGPHSALAGPIKQIIQDDYKLRTADITYLSILSRKHEAVTSALQTASTLAAMNYPLDLEEINFPKDVECTRKPQLLVDMPPYRWNHTKSYWAEPRLSKTYRNREFPRTDLLGASDNIACPFERRWRNYLRVSEIPWLQDHRIQSDTIFPAAGYIAMSIEAIMQLIKDTDLVEAFTLKDVRIHSALIVPESTGVEVMTSLRDFDGGQGDERDRWYEFHIYSVSNENRWTEHCVGIVGTEVDLSLTDDETFVDLNGLATAPGDIENSHISVIDIPQLYKRLHDIGLNYGPLFSNLTCAHTTQQGICFAEVMIPTTQDVMPMNFEHQYLIHPCTLDSIFHTIFAALPEDMDLETGPLIPVSFESMRISSQIQRSPGEVLSVCTHHRPALKKIVVASIMATDSLGSNISTKPKLSINGIRCVRLEGSAAHLESKINIPITYGIEWQADPAFVSKENAAFLFQQQDLNQIEIPALPERDDLYTAKLIKDTIVTLSAEYEEKSDSSSIRYRDDLTAILKMHRMDRPIDLHMGSTPLSKENIDVPCDKETLFRAISHLLSLSSLSDPETFRAAQSKLWDMYYHNTMIKNSAYYAAVNYLGLIGHKKPDISVLELSDGADRPYNLFLEKLIPQTSAHQGGTPHCSKYTFVHTNKNVFERARADYANWNDRVNFEKLNLNCDLPQQESSKQAYDVIIAPNAFYSMYSSMDKILKIKSLLKSGGYLMILNTLLPRKSILGALLATVLYNWPQRAADFWKYDDGMKEENLREAGFKVENIIDEVLIICRPDYGMDCFDKKILIISENDSGASRKLSRALQRQLPGESTVSNTIKSLPKGRICIILSDLERSLFHNPDAELLQKLKEIFLQSEGVLWVTRGGTMHATNPQAGLAVGFARTARSESGVQQIITLDLDPNFSILDDMRIQTIVNLIKTHFFKDRRPEYDSEYAERDGIVLIPRVVVQDDLNREIMKMNKTDMTVEQNFQEPDRTLSLLRSEVRKKEIYFTATKQFADLPEGHIGIKVCAFAMSEFDIDLGDELNTSPSTMGFGCSGQVYELGPNVHGFSVGDRVACLGTGTARNYYYDQACAFQKIEEHISYELAASLPLAFTAAHYLRHEICRINRGDKVIVHDAASWYGQALVAICILSECEIIAIVSNQSQKSELSKSFRLGPQHVFLDEMDMDLHLLEFTQGRLPRTVITSAESNSRTFRSLRRFTAPFGHIIQLRTQSPCRKVPHILGSDSKNISFSTFDMADLRPERIPAMYNTWSTVMSLFNQGKLQGPSFYSVHKVTDVVTAIDIISSAKFAVITAEDDHMVQVATVLESRISKKIFDKNASYLLVGGLGGIGHAIASWMVEHGAKSLILVNRQGLSTDTARSIVQPLREKGAVVAVYGCDISNEEALSEMYTQVSQTMPPIKGVIQGAMILKDVHIEQMTAEDFNTVLRPKYAGTWNLHKHLPANMDFFVMLSSISGVIGNATQSAYAAGSAFMDSFAAYRNQLGLPAVSLDLGAITSVGYLAENKELAEKMAKQGFQSTDMQTLLSLVRLAISQPPTSPHSQLVTGLGEWKPGISPSNFDTPLFSHFRRMFQTNDPQEVGPDHAEILHENLRAAKTRDEAALVVFEALSERIATQLGIPADRISPGSPLSDFGIDSTDAVELRKWIAKTMESTVPILEILASGSVLQLAGQIASRSQLLNIDDKTL